METGFVHSYFDTHFDNITVWNITVGPETKSGAQMGVSRTGPNYI